MELISRDDIAKTHQGPGYVVGKNQKQTNLNPVNNLVGLFTGVNTFIDFLQESMPEARQEKASSRHKEDDYGQNFHKFDTYEEAIDTFKNHPHKVCNFDEKTDQVRSGDESGNNILYDVQGDFLDIGRYLEGDPECVGVSHQGNIRGYRVNIQMNLDFPSHVKEEDIAHRSRRTQRLVDWLEGQQVRVAMTAIASAGTGHVEIGIKHHDDIFDINNLAVASHSDFFRRLIFRFEEYSDCWRAGYGSGSLLAETFRRQVLVWCPEANNEINIRINNSVDGISESFDHLESWLIKVLADQPTSPRKRSTIIL